MRAVEAADGALPGKPTAADRLVAEVVATTRALRRTSRSSIVELDAELPAALPADVAAAASRRSRS